MQINGLTQIHGAQSISGPHASRGVAGCQSCSTSSVGDQLDISPAGQLAGQLADIPAIRADRVADIRAALANGTYETPDKLNTALERLLDEIA
jgi:negative regulator of flagellin synthesis FlgM